MNNIFPPKPEPDANLAAPQPDDEPVHLAVKIGRLVLAASILLPILAGSLWVTIWLIVHLPK